MLNQYQQTEGWLVLETLPSQQERNWIGGTMSEYSSVYYAVAQGKIYFQIYIYPKILIKQGNQAKINANRVNIDVALRKPFFVRV